MRLLTLAGADAPIACLHAFVHHWWRTAQRHVDQLMKARVLIWFVLCVQVVFLAYWLFASPEVHGELQVTRDELQQGAADLPAITFRHSDSTETTVTYDPTKSSSDNLLARARLRLWIADEGYQSLASIAVLATLLSVVLLVLVLVLNYRRSNQPLQATAAPPHS